MSTSATKAQGKTRDLALVAVLFLATFSYCALATSSLDFIRDTEADRSLISLEMLRHGTWAVPHLLGQEFMTKPPGFYWAQACSFAITGSKAPWAARLPSAFFTALLVAAHFIFLRKLGWATKQSLFSAAGLATCAAIFRLSIMAEIDMTFTALTALAVYVGYFSIVGQHRLPASLLAWACAALAFLVKGPPVLLFFAGGMMTFFLVLVVYEPADRRMSFCRTIIPAQLAGLLLFLLIVGLWVGAVIHEIGWQRVVDHWNFQVVDRVTGSSGTHSGKARSPLFYAGATLAGSIPWTPLLLGLLLPLLSAAGRKGTKEGLRVSAGGALPRQPDPYDRALLYALAVLVPSYLGLTLTAGKASRYMLPLWPMLAICCSWAANRFGSGRFETYLCKGVAVLGSLIALASLAATPKAITLAGETTAGAVAALALAVPALAMAITAWQARPERYHRLAIAVIVLIVCARLPYCLVFAKKRNRSHSPRPAAAELHRRIPSGEPLYILRMFERWICYYVLTEQGRPVLRLRPDHLAAWQAGVQATKWPDEALPRGPRRYLLLNARQERETLTALRNSDESTAILYEFEQNKRQFWLVETSAEALVTCQQHLNLLGRS